MWPDQVLNLRPLALESDAIPTAPWVPAKMNFTFKGKNLHVATQIFATS